MQCSECAHWKETAFSLELNARAVKLEYDPNYRKGLCDELRSAVEIEVNAGWNGGTVGDIETEAKFFCAAFKPKGATPC